MSGFAFHFIFVVLVVCIFLLFYKATLESLFSLLLGFKMTSASTSTVPASTTEYTWEVDDFAGKWNYKHSGKISLLSPYDPVDTIKITLRLNSNHRLEVWGGINSLLHLVLTDFDREDKNNSDLMVHYRVSILNANGEKCATQQGVVKLSLSGDSMYAGLFQMQRSFLLDEANELLVNGKLVFHCEFKVLDNGSRILELANREFPFNLIKDLEHLLEETKSSDLVISIVGANVKLAVHKCILIARSKVFAAMFEHEMTESILNRIEINDFSVEAVESMIRYIYTGKLQTGLSFDLAAELLTASDKYQIDSLKSVLENFLGSTLNFDHAPSVLILADNHQAKLLKAKCVDYINANISAVMQTESWKVLTETRIQLVLDLFKDFVSKSKNTDQ